MREQGAQGLLWLGEGSGEGLHLHCGGHVLRRALEMGLGGCQHGHRWAEPERGHAAGGGRHTMRDLGLQEQEEGCKAGWAVY